MNYILVPVSKLLLEYIIKIKDAILFPSYDFENCTFDEDIDKKEIDMIKKISSENLAYFNEFKIYGLSLMLIPTKYSKEELTSNTTIIKEILHNASRLLDYVIIQQCLFSKPEYLVGTPGQIESAICYFILDNENKIVEPVVGGRKFYSIQPGLGLDLSFSQRWKEDGLYKALYSYRSDEVFLEYRTILGSACDAMHILDVNRCFVYLFSKIDRMGNCKTYNFTDNKKRIIACLAESQARFDSYSNQYYFYSKQVRTEIVHYGNHILNYIPAKKAYSVVNDLFLLIVNFSQKVIETGITTFGDLDKFLDQQVDKFNYKKPEDSEVGESRVSSLDNSTYVYVAEINNFVLEKPLKMGKTIFLPERAFYKYTYYYQNYVKIDLSKFDYDEEFEGFSSEDLDYALNIIKHKDIQKLNENATIAIITHKPFLVESEKNQVGYDLFCDYICSEIEKGFHYFVLMDKQCNMGILPSKAGITDHIRGIYQYDERTEHILFIHGRVYQDYYEPEEQFYIKSDYQIFYPDLFNTLYNTDIDEISSMCRNALNRVCESYYISDWTVRITYLFDILDMLFPLTTKGDKLMKHVLAFVCKNKNEYDNEKVNFIQIREKYRNRLLHGGKNIFELVDLGNEINEINELSQKLEKYIIDYCANIHCMGIFSFTEYNMEYIRMQKLLGIIR